MHERGGADERVRSYDEKPDVTRAETKESPGGRRRQRTAAKSDCAALRLKEPLNVHERFRSKHQAHVRRQTTLYMHLYTRLGLHTRISHTHFYNGLTQDYKRKCLHPTQSLGIPIRPDASVAFLRSVSDADTAGSQVARHIFFNASRKARFFRRRNERFHTT